MTGWSEHFFDKDYLRIWESREADGKTESEAADLWRVLELKEGSKVLDAPCGYGRISRALAERGARVIGVDLSPALLAEAERRRGGLAAERLRYYQHDLRTAVGDSGFDAALNIFSSLGYGTEAEDVATLSTLRGAVRQGGAVFIETMHRDRLVAGLAHICKSGSRLPDGTLLVEEVRFDQLAGRAESVWYWNGPGGSGEKRSSIRLYTVTELVRMVESVGLKLRTTHQGCSPEPFVAAPGSTFISNRLGLLAVRP